nr:hypothetical protein [Volvox africanus]
MDAGPLSYVCGVSSVGAAKRRRGTPPAAIAFIGLGIASVTAAFALVMSRLSSKSNARGPAAKKKVHNSARSGSLRLGSPQRGSFSSSYTWTTASAKASSPPASATTVALPSSVMRKSRNALYLPGETSYSSTAPMPVPSGETQTLLHVPPSIQDEGQNQGFVSAPVAGVPVMITKTGTSQLCSLSPVPAITTAPVAASEPATTTTLVPMQRPFSSREPVLCTTMVAAQSVLSASTFAAVPTERPAPDFSPIAPDPAVREIQSPPLVATSCPSSAVVAADCSSAHTSGPGVMMAKLQPLLQTSAATVTPNECISVRPLVQLPERRIVAGIGDQAQESSDTAQEFHQRKPTQHSAKDNLALDLLSGKASVVSDDAGTALAEQDGELETARLVSTALKVDGGENCIAPEEVEPQSGVEAEAEQLLLAATTAWNVHGNRAQGVKLSQRALAALRAGPHRAKYRSDVASSLADMLYGMNRWEEALEAVGEAMQAAREAGEWAMAIKLANNMGAVYKKLDRISDAIALHRSCYAMAVAELGVAHPLSLLARTNLTETLTMRNAYEPGAGGQEDNQEVVNAAQREARQLLQAALAQLEAEAGTQRAALETVMTVNDDEELGKDDVGNSIANGNHGSSELPTSKYRRTRTAIVRTHIELGRLEMMAGEDPDAAEGAFRAALALCDELYGVDSRESGGPAFSLANCLRSIGKKDEARALYERLFDLIVKRNGQGEETAVHLARSLADLAEEAGDWAATDRFSSAALHSMTLLIGTRVHPVLESFYQAACRAKIHNGDAAGAEALRRQYLTAMLRLSQQQARNPGGRRVTAAVSGTVTTAGQKDASSRSHRKSGGLLRKGGK